jgi:hypothetical protein
MADQHDVDEKSGKRVLPESRLREAQPGRGQDRDLAAQIRLGPE